MVIYPDTSVLVPLYMEEEKSQVVDRYVAGLSSPLAFTPYHRLELRTALRLRVFREESTDEELRQALRLLDNHLHGQLYRHSPLDWNATLRESERLGATHVADTGVRSGDLFHVSSAVVLEADEFVTLDHRQAELARRAGLKVKTWR